MVVANGIFCILVDVTVSEDQNSEEAHILWTNGVPQVFKAGLDQYRIHGLGVRNGNVYYCGVGEKGGLYTAFYYLNGQKFTIAEEMGADYLSVIDIAVVAGDVYVIGSERNPDGTTNPVFWINNEAQEVNVGSGYFFNQIIVR